MVKITKGNLVDDIVVSNPGLNGEAIAKFNQPDQDKYSIKLEFLDMPGIYHFMNKNFSEFFDELTNTEGYDYYNNKAI